MYHSSQPSQQVQAIQSSMHTAATSSSHDDRQDTRIRTWDDGNHLRQLKRDTKRRTTSQNTSNTTKREAGATVTPLLTTGAGLQRSERRCQLNCFVCCDAELATRWSSVALKHARVAHDLHSYDYVHSSETVGTALRCDARTAYPT